MDNSCRNGDNPEYIAVMKKIKESEKWLDPIRGCLIGGAAGDALGYPVEFLSFGEICGKYGTEGIGDYQVSRESGKALISDDTQMTLFTANGILKGATRMYTRGVAGPPEGYIHMAYLDWLETQTGKPSKLRISWLSETDGLRFRRAPGLTCLSALESGVMGTLEKPINNSKGCGGIMRVAPIALYPKRPDPLTGAKVAAITHGHPLGYMPAAALVQIISRIVYGGCPKGDTLYDIVGECFDVMGKLFPGNEYLNDLLGIMELAVTLSRNGDSDIDNIVRIGKGWVAEETLGISLYCALKYYGDFSRAVTAAVNHGGDSDSTGSVTGNIVGAHIGYNGIPGKWKKDLELHDIILEIADDICHDCQMDEYSSSDYMGWSRKY